MGFSMNRALVGNSQAKQLNREIIRRLSELEARVDELEKAKKKPAKKAKKEGE